MAQNRENGHGSGRIPVGILGATGAVGQRFISLLADHPWFEVTAVAASERSAGKRYEEAVNWVIPGEIPPGVTDLIVTDTDDIDALGDVRMLFSALPSSAARELEPALAARGYIVCTNASALRMDPDVPLLIPEINADHVGLIDAQRERRGWPGLIVASPNCAVTAVIFPLRALHDAFGLTQTHVVTMQAISGAGYPGVSSFDIFDNVIPYIGGEESKFEGEPHKMLGTLVDGQIRLADFVASAQVNRVPVIDGHLAALSVGLKREASVAEVEEVLAAFQPPAIARELPSAPRTPMILRTEPDRPQLRRDRDAEKGMAVSVGRVQPCPVLGIKLVAMVHNTLRGAAGGAILNAELLAAAGYIQDYSVQPTAVSQA
ncbi:MAG: aspartate-semialdehyde dehydrogenase [Chloroflexota bacterium]